jgi:hypothetical protein
MSKALIGWVDPIIVLGQAGNGSTVAWAQQSSSREHLRRACPGLEMGARCSCQTVLKLIAATRKSPLSRNLRLSGRRLNESPPPGAIANW